MDGYVVIGTELDTKQLEQDLKNAKKELAQFQREEERLLKEKGKVQLQLSAYDEEKAKIKENTDEMLKKAETEEQVTNLLQMENIELDKLTQKYAKQFSTIAEINDKLKNNQLQQGLINGKIDEANDKLSQSKGYEKVRGQLGKISNSTSDIIKKVGKWALAVFSVRSAYMFIRQLSGTLAQYNAQYGANLEYIRYALAQAIAPVLEYLVDLAFKLLSYLNYIVNAWFGINLFSKASAKNFASMAGSASSIKKSLQSTGFDEMEVLADTSSSGGGGGVGIPSFDLSDMNEEIPPWIKWIADNKDIVLGFLEGLAILLAGIKLGKILQDLVGISNTLKGLKGMSRTIIDLALVIGGITLYAGSIAKILNGDTSVGNLLKGLAGAGMLGKGASALLGLSNPVTLTLMASLMIILTAIWLEKKTDEYMSQIANIIGVEYDGKNFFQKKAIQFDLALQFMGLKETNNAKIKQLLDEQETLFEKTGRIIKPVYDWFIRLVEKTNETGKAIGEWFTNLVIDTNTTWETIKKTFSVVPNWIDTNIIQPVSTFFSTLWGNITTGASNTWNGIVSFITGIPNWIDTHVIAPIGNFFTNLWNGIKNTFASVWNWILGAFSKGGQIFNGVKEGIVSVFKTAVNGVTSGINRVMSSALGGLNSILNKIKSITIMNYKPFDGLWGWNPVYVPQIPKLAVGGIVNMPRKRNLFRRCNDRRTWSRRCNSINR